MVDAGVATIGLTLLFWTRMPYAVYERCLMGREGWAFFFFPFSFFFFCPPCLAAFFFLSLLLSALPLLLDLFFYLFPIRRFIASALALALFFIINNRNSNKALRRLLEHGYDKLWQVPST